MRYAKETDNKLNKLKLVTGVTAPGSVVLLEGQLKYFYEKGYECYLICPPEERVKAFCKKENCTHLSVTIKRDISILKDISSLYKIYKYFKIINPDIVNAGTPKMGLLAMIAARLIGVKKRIYTCRGFRFEQENGMRRRILILMEKIAGLCAHEIICISPSLKEYAISKNIFSPNKTFVLNKGSSNGINLRIFNRENNIVMMTELKRKYDLENKFVFGYIGRLVDSKGILELFDAFCELYRKNEYFRLVTVGANPDLRQIKDNSIIDKYKSHPGIINIEYQKEVSAFMQMFDVFVLPTWREGFGNVLIQAAALGIPCITTDVTGAKDAVKKDFNGIIVPAKDTVALSNAMLELFNDNEKRTKLGINGIEWAKNFDNKIIWEGMNDLYMNRFNNLN